MIAVRPAEQRDADEAIDVVRKSISDLCVADHQNDQETLAAWLANKTAQSFFRWISNPENFCVIAESDNHIVGVGVLQRGGEILLFYLAPGAQRRGIGRKIHDALEEKAARWQLESLHLDSTALARPFYEALGYRPVGPPIPRFGVLRCFPYAKKLQPGISLERTREK